MKIDIGSITYDCLSINSLSSLKFIELFSLIYVGTLKCILTRNIVIDYRLKVFSKSYRDKTYVEMIHT